MLYDARTDRPRRMRIQAPLRGHRMALDLIGMCGWGGLVTVQTCGDLPTIGPIVEGQPSTVFPLQTVSVPSNVNSYAAYHTFDIPKLMINDN